MARTKSKESGAAFAQADMLMPVREQQLFAAMQAGRKAKENPNGDPTVRKKMIQEGKICRQSLIVAYLPLVADIAKRYITASIPLPDLIQEGTLGLLRAVDSYDPACGIKLSAVVTVKVKNTLYDLLAVQKRPMRYPVKIGRAVNKIRRISTCMTQELGHPPSDEEIAEETRTPAEIVRRLLQLDEPISSLDILTGENDKTTIGELLASDAPTPEDLLLQDDLRERIRQVLDTLEPMEETVIKLRFGFLDGTVLSPEMTAEEMNLSPEEVSRIEVKALRKLRHPSRSLYLRDFLYD